MTPHLQSLTAVQLGTAAVAVAQTHSECLRWEELAQVVSHDEFAYAQRFPDDRLAYRYLARCYAKRVLLAHLTGTNPHGLRLARDRFRRPYLETADDAGISISHSGTWTAVAMVKSARVGIDIETVDRWPAIARVVGLWATKIEQPALDVQHNDYFERLLRWWTGKEAVLKCDGRGLMLPLNAAQIVERNDRFIAVLDHLIGSRLNLTEPLAIDYLRLSDLVISCVSSPPYSDIDLWQTGDVDNPLPPLAG